MRDAPARFETAAEMLARAPTGVTGEVTLAELDGQPLVLEWEERSEVVLVRIFANAPAEERRLVQRVGQLVFRDTTVGIDERLELEDKTGSGAETVVRESSGDWMGADELLRILAANENPGPADNHPMKVEPTAVDGARAWTLSASYWSDDYDKATSEKLEVRITIIPALARARVLRRWTAYAGR